MKKPLSVLLGFALTALVFISCQRNNATPSIQSQLVGKWIVKNAVSHSIVQGVPYQDTTAYTTADYLDFHADSTLTIVISGGTYTGKWSIVNSRLFISETNYMDWPNGWDLPVLTRTDLQMLYKETSQSASLDAYLNLYR